MCITTPSPWNGNPYRANGGAGKAAVASMVKSLAVEWGQYGIRINEVGPGSITTAAMAAMGEEIDDSAAHIPLRRVGTPADIADATLFTATGAVARWWS